ncbi:unnamed protein product [Polarella glacialis]|uniref:Oxidoreductase FAD/NAD(P)-binding domain-containing protein n=1 Tax=Polarella glacialis TaxID=89957 RepID=A0A813HW44_POLGL|nr:unnamed protein product [Polarella glacialis]
MSSLAFLEPSFTQRWLRSSGSRCHAADSDLQKAIAKATGGQFASFESLPASQGLALRRCARILMRLLFNDRAGANADGSRKFNGIACLFMGVPFSKSLLSDDEPSECKAKYPSQFKFDYAVPREDKNAAGQKMYIQTKMAEYKEELWEMMQSPKTHIYMCGLKGMESGIAEKAGIDQTEFSKQMKRDDRYHVEV